MGSEEEAAWFGGFCTRLRQCVGCTYALTRNTVVCPEGPPDSYVVFIGEAPGDEEDRQGRPFVGFAGKILDGWLDDLAFPREWVYITNRVKCRPVPHGRPTQNCLERCDRWIEEELRMLRPKVVATLGNTALRLFRPYDSVMKVHGEVFDVSWVHNRFKLVPLYHPAHCLYQGLKLPGMRSDHMVLGEVLNE